MSNWKKNIKITVRMKIWIKDFFIKKTYNPFQVVRRRIGLAEKDLFKHILIQTNYKCTRKCYFCHYGLETPPKNIDMDEDLFCNIINQLRDINYKGRVGLFEMNEPLTDKRFNKFLKYSRENLPKAWIFISSNGDLLSVEKAEQLFKDGLNFIYLSSYDEAAVERNLKILKEINPKYRNRINHLNRTYQTAWTSRGGNVTQFKKETVLSPCDLVHRVLYIKPTGKIYSCYNDFYNINEMGDLNEDKLLDIWFGDKFKQLRQNLIAGNRNFSELCKECDYNGYGNLPRIPFSWRLKNLVKVGD